MAQLMKFAELRQAALLVGIDLNDAPVDRANLYVLVDPADNDIYIGKAKSKQRYMHEDAPGLEDYTSNLYSGFVALKYENETARRALRYEQATFQAERLLEHISTWLWRGSSVDLVRARLRDQLYPTVEEVEQIMVRIHVRAGRLIGNSQFASQWDRAVGSFVDTIAAVAVHAAQASGLLKMRVWPSALT